MFEEFYGMYEPEEQEVIALINRCIGGGSGQFYGMHLAGRISACRSSGP